MFPARGGFRSLAAMAISDGINWDRTRRMSRRACWAHRGGSGAHEYEMNMAASPFVSNIDRYSYLVRTGKSTAILVVFMLRVARQYSLDLLRGKHFSNALRDTRIDLDTPLWYFAASKEISMSFEDVWRNAVVKIKSGRVNRKKTSILCLLPEKKKSR